MFIPSGYKDAEEILNMRRYAFRKYYLRPKYIFARITDIKSWYDLQRYWRGFKLITKRYVF